MAVSSMGREQRVVALALFVQGGLKLLEAVEVLVDPGHIGKCAVVALYLGLVGWAMAPAGHVLDTQSNQP